MHVTKEIVFLNATDQSLDFSHSSWNHDHTLVRDAMSGYVYGSAEASGKAATGDLDSTIIHIMIYNYA